MKKFRKIACLLAVMIMIMATTATSFAGTVTYKNQAEKFIFAPGSEYSKTDLFGDQFKGVMPGDVITDTVTVKNEASEKVDVQIFMRALGSTDLQNPEDGIAEVSQQDSDLFLDEMDLRVFHEDGRVLFDAAANETAQLTDWVKLGDFKSGETVDLAIELTVPITMGNDFQTRIGALDWQFKVIETPVPEKVVQTGDDSNMIVPMSLMGIALLAIILALATRRRKQEQ